MDTAFAMSKAGGRDALAQLLAVAPITTYHWKTVLPAKHERYMRLLRPDWFVEFSKARRKKPR